MKWKNDRDLITDSEGKLIAHSHGGEIPNKMLVDAHNADIDSYEEVLEDHRRLVRELDVIWNGEADAAKQASLCDLVAQIKNAI